MSVTPEIGMVVVTGLAAVLVTWLILSFLRRSEAAAQKASRLGEILDLTNSYLGHYLFASVVMSPLLGMALGKPLLILLLPLFHLLAAAMIFPGAMILMYAARRWLNRTWTRTRAWTAAFLSVGGMWMISFVLVVGHERPPEVLVHLLGEMMAAVAFVVSVPMIASAMSLTLAWMVPSRVPRGTFNQ